MARYPIEDLEVRSLLPSAVSPCAQAFCSACQVLCSVHLLIKWHDHRVIRLNPWPVFASTAARLSAVASACFMQMQGREHTHYFKVAVLHSRYLYGIV